VTGLPPLGETQEAPPLDFFSSVAVMAPRGRDETVARQLLAKDGIASISVLSLTQLSELISQHIGAVLITEEALSGADADALALALDAQPSWSDVPFIVLANGTTGSRSERAAQRIDTLSNAVLLSRPLHAEELIRAVRSSLTARGRQHQARRQLEELQLRERQLFESEAKFQAIANSVDQMIWSTLPDGFHDYFNDRWYEFTGVPAGSTDGEGWNGIFHPDDQERAWERWRHSLSTGENYEIEYRLRHRSGDYRWVLGRAQPY
jgi:PAS domain S-box-containing protein